MLGVGLSFAPFQFGRVYTASQLAPSWLEQEWLMRFMAPFQSNGRMIEEYPMNTAGTARFPHRGMSIVRLMKNATGGAIKAGALVIPSASNYPSEIADETATAEVSCGVVDPFLTADPAANEYCVVIVEGMCMYKLPNASASVTALDLVIPHATEDGRIEPVDATPDNDAEAQNQAMCCVGRVLETSDVENALVIGYKRRQW